MRSAECRVQNVEFATIRAGRGGGRGKALRIAECGLRIETQKPKNSSAGGGRNPRDATVAHLAGGLVRRAPLTATQNAECRVRSDNGNGQRPSPPRPPGTRRDPG